LWGEAGELLGMGVSSYSYLNGTVFQNTSDWGTYVGKLTNGESAVSRGLRLNYRQRVAREFILGLKLLRVERGAFRRRTGFDPLELWQSQVDALQREGILEVTNEAIALTQKARPYVDVVCSVFYLPEHAEWKFHRFATEDELAKAALLQVSEIPKIMANGHLQPRSEHVSSV
jgi:oxygen-independent coproporphyrinogen-3 oxidase